MVAVLLRAEKDHADLAGQRCLPAQHPGELQQDAHGGGVVPRARRRCDAVVVGHDADQRQLVAPAVADRRQVFAPHALQAIKCAAQQRAVRLGEAQRLQLKRQMIAGAALRRRARRATADFVAQIFCRRADVLRAQLRLRNARRRQQRRRQHAADHATQPPVHTKYSAPLSSDHAFVPPFSVQFFPCLVPWPDVYVHHSFAMDARFSCRNVKKRCCKAGFGSAFFAILARYATKSCMNWKKSEKG